MHWRTFANFFLPPPFAMVTELIDRTLSRFPRFSSSEIEVEPLEKGGSDRKFYRVRAGDSSLILAKYGSQREENLHYVVIAQFLRGLGVRVPEIYFHEPSEGLIWMEDLGERDLWSYRQEPWAIRKGLYENTLDEALTLHTRAHRAPAAEIPQLQAEFNAELYRWEQNYFLDHCLCRHFGMDKEMVEAECGRAALDAMAERLHELPRAFVHRDFQSQNIVVVDGQACFIDFQGMRPGLVQYDLASLLYDPYVELTEEERNELLDYYLAAAREAGETERGDFREVYDLCAVQRLMQALGAYGFLGHVKERPTFLEHIPAALGLLRGVAGRVKGLEELCRLLDKAAAA